MSSALQVFDGDFFKLQSARITEFVFRHFRNMGFDFAEDVAQDALLQALRMWPIGSTPENPEAWLTTTAKNIVFNRLKQERGYSEKAGAVFESREKWGSDWGAVDWEEVGSGDSTLHLMFMFCHPSISEASQLALMLKALAGLSVDQISAGFLETKETIQKRLLRGKEKLGAQDIAQDWLNEEQMRDRLPTILRAIYLIFSEGYKASTGESLIHFDLAREAIRLTRILLESRVGNTPTTYALLALMLLHVARFGGRIGKQGEMVTLRYQDRSLWDRGLIAEGMKHLEASASGATMTPYHLQATIAALHSTSVDYASTDWARILEFYDLLMQLEPTPIVALNRAVAVAETQGPEAGLKSLEAIEALSNHYLFFAVRADFADRMGNREMYQQDLERAIRLCQSVPERKYLISKKK